MVVDDEVPDPTGRMGTGGLFDLVTVRDGLKLVPQ